MVWVRVHSDDLSSQLRRWWSRGWKAAGHDEGDEPCLKWSLERGEQATQSGGGQLGSMKASPGFGSMSAQLPDAGGQGKLVIYQERSWTRRAIKSGGA